MKRVAVTSSSVTSIGYDPVAAVLEIEFQNGRIKARFDAVPV